MSTHVNDVAAVSVKAALAPAVRAAAANGVAVDLLAADGPCFAVQQIGALSGATWTGAIEESADATQWAPVAGAAFAPVDESDDIQTITFRRTKRYVRYVGAVTGASPSVAVAAAIGQQLKTI